MSEQGNNIENPQDSKILKKEWQSLKDTITKTAEKTLGHKNDTANKDWITTEIVSMIKERRKYKSLNSTEGQKTYRSLRNLVIRKSREAKGKYQEEK